MDVSALNEEAADGPPVHHGDSRKRRSYASNSLTAHKRTEASTVHTQTRKVRIVEE